MAFRNPNMINLSGNIEPGDLIDEWPAGVAVTPGMQCVMYNNSGVISVKPQDTAANMQSPFIALSRPEENKGVADVYAIGDRVPLWTVPVGKKFWGIVITAITVNQMDELQSNGDGKYKLATAATAAANVACFKSLETLGLTSGDTRCRMIRTR